MIRSTYGPSQHSLFRQSRADTLENMARHQQLTSVIQKFESLLWNQVAQSMNSVSLGPDMLGPGGHMMQRMMWRRVTQTQFGGISSELTQSTLEQLLPRTASDNSGNVTGQSAVTKTRPAQATPRQASSQSAGANDERRWMRHILGAIKTGARTLDVPVAALLAQAALETGWGESMQGNNLFGVKAHDQGAGFTTLTHEFTRGAMRPVYASFQRYTNPDDAVSDFVATIQRMHPGAVGQQTIADYARSLQASGYATDPHYAAKIVAVAHSEHMHELLQSVKS